MIRCMEIYDLAAAAELAHRRQVLLAVDDTFMSPCLQRPLEHGADSRPQPYQLPDGHSDGVGGAVILRDATLAERLRFLQNAAGAILGPMDSWLVLRGVQTLAVACVSNGENGIAVAKFLAKHPKVRKVHYPGLPTIRNTHSPSARCPASAAHAGI